MEITGTATIPLNVFVTLEAKSKAYDNANLILDKVRDLVKNKPVYRNMLGDLQGGEDYLNLEPHDANELILKLIVALRSVK